MRRKHILLALLGIGTLVAMLLVVRPRPKSGVRYRVVFLPTLGGVSVSPRAINDHGQIAGVAQGNAKQCRLFLWDPNGGMRDLGPCVDPWSFGRVWINNAGQVAAGTMDPNGSGHVFLLDPNGVRHILRPPKGEEIHIHDLNNRGQIVGYLRQKGGPRRGFIWDRTTGRRDLPISAGASMATGINDRGQIVGSCSDQPMGSRWNVFLQDPNAGVQDLGFPGVYPASMCYINNQGFIVGRFEENALSIRTREGQWRRLCPDKRAAVQIQGLDEANRFVACTHARRFMIREFARLTHIDSYVWDPTEGFMEIAGRLGRTDVIEFFATDINNAGQITGLLRLRNQPNPFGVVLRPVFERQGKW